MSTLRTNYIVCIKKSDRTDNSKNSKFTDTWYHNPLLRRCNHTCVVGASVVAVAAAATVIVPDPLLIVPNIIFLLPSESGTLYIKCHFMFVHEEVGVFLRPV